MDISISDLPISKPGEKTAAANVSYMTGKLGKRVRLPDLEWTATGAKNELTSLAVTAIFVKNAGSALVPGTVAKWSVAGTTVNGNAVGDELGAGIVDPSLSSNVATNECFLLFVKGPTKVLCTGAISANAAIKSTTSGKVDTNAFADVGDYVSFAGVMLEAGSTDALKRAVVDYRI